MQNHKRFMIPILLAVLAVSAALFGASNFIQAGDRVTLTWSSTSPTAGDPVVKCASKATGGIVGVALTGGAVADENVVVMLSGVFDLSVTASSTVGNIAVGDYIFTSVSGITTCTADLSNINSGLLFGQALEAITATTTAGVYETIKVRIVQPAHL